MALCLVLEAVLKYGWHITLNIAKTEEAMNPKSCSQLGIVLVFFAAFVPFYEELLFRGYIFGWLKRVTPLWLATIISAAIFALVHGLFISRDGVSGWVGTGEIFLLGCLMAWWVARTGSLRPSYVVHIVNNATAFILAFFLPNLP
jgi:membrane protease YdiL (CAAX protease family)